MRDVTAYMAAQRGHAAATIALLEGGASVDKGEANGCTNKGFRV